MRISDKEKQYLFDLNLDFFEVAFRDVCKRFLDEAPRAEQGSFREYIGMADFILESLELKIDCAPHHLDESGIQEYMNKDFYAAAVALTTVRQAIERTIRQDKEAGKFLDMLTMQARAEHNRREGLFLETCKVERG